MAEVTVIAPNVVAFVGNLARQGTPVAERSAPPPPPPPRPDQPLRTRNDAGGQSRQLTANQNTPQTTPRPPRTTAPGGFNLSGKRARRPAQPSVQFLAQQIAQESARPTSPAANFAAAAGAYGKLQTAGPQTAADPIIITRSVDRTA